MLPTPLAGSRTPGSTGGSITRGHLSSKPITALVAGGRSLSWEMAVLHLGNETFFDLR